MDPYSAIAIGGGILKTIADLAGGNAQAEQARARADIARQNAAQTRVERDIALERIKNQTSKAYSTQRTQAATGNLVSTQGSALDILMEGASRSYQFQEQTSKAYDAREYGFLTQARAYDEGADDIGTATVINASSALLGTAKNVGDMQGWWTSSGRKSVG
jgi:hypothetical protein